MSRGCACDDPRRMGRLVYVKLLRNRGLTLGQIGRKLSISPERVRYMERAALRELLARVPMDTLHRHDMSALV